MRQRLLLAHRQKVWSPSIFHVFKKVLLERKTYGLGLKAGS